MADTTQMRMVFTPCFGVVEVATTSCSTTEDALRFFTLRVDNDVLPGIAQDIDIELSGNYQSQHTVNKFVYFYAFGDRISAFNISGVGFVKACANNAVKGSLMRLYDYYNANRASKKNGKSALLTISTNDGTTSNTKTFRGFLTGMKMSIKASEALGTVGYWTLRFEVLPDLTQDTSKTTGRTLPYAAGGTGGTAATGAGTVI